MISIWLIPKRVQRRIIVSLVVALCASQSIARWIISFLILIIADCRGVHHYFITIYITWLPTPTTNYSHYFIKSELCLLWMHYRRWVRLNIFVGARDDGIALNGLIYLDRYICLPRFVDILMDRRLILFYIRRARYYFGVVILYVFHVFLLWIPYQWHDHCKQLFSSFERNYSKHFFCSLFTFFPRRKWMDLIWFFGWLFFHSVFFGTFRCSLLSM